VADFILDLFELSAVMAAVLMKEKPTKQSLIGILIALTAIVFMNL